MRLHAVVWRLFAVLVVLGAMLGILAINSLQRTRSDLRTAATLSDINAIGDLLAMDNCAAQEGIAILAESNDVSAGIVRYANDGHYGVPAHLSDRWGTRLEYHSTTSGFTIVSAGPDMRIGTKDDLYVHRRRFLK